MAAPTTAPEKPMEEKATAPIKVEERRPRFADPFDLFEELRDELARLWGQRPLLARSTTRPFPALATGTWIPRMDVYEQNGNLMIKAELPGMQKEDIKVELQEGDLLITGERKAESEVKEEDYYRVERAYGSFYRRLPLPFEAKPEDIKATYKDGVLEVQIPKPAQAAADTKKIAIS
jgi:HSP20 family protein